MSEKTSDTVWNTDKTKPKAEFKPEMCIDTEIIQDALRDHPFTDDKFDLLEKIILQCPGVLNSKQSLSGLNNPALTPEIRRMLMEQADDANRQWIPPAPPGTIHVEDILTNPGAQPTDPSSNPASNPASNPVKTTTEQSNTTTTEGFDGLMDEKEKAFMTAMKQFKDDPTPEHAKQVVVQIMTSISRIFYIPDMMAAEIVNNGYKKGGKSEIDPKDKINFAEDFELVRSHLQSYIMVLVSLFAALNWWYLLFYTSHYVDIKQMLTNPLFTPFIWVIGPIMSPLMTINYWLLGKRLDLSFFNSVVKPVMEKKSFWFTVYLLVFCIVYRPISKFYGDSVQKIQNNEPNAFYSIILFFACFNYFYSVVFNKDRMFFAQRVFSSIILTFILFLILFIFLMMLTKVAVVVIIAYFAFYSIAPLFVFSGGPHNVFFEIVRMIRDSSNVCVSANIEGSLFVEIKNNLYRYSALIFMSILVLGAIGRTMGDLPKIHNKDVKTLCGLLYSIAFIVQIITMAGIISPKMVNWVKELIVNGWRHLSGDTSATPVDTAVPGPEAEFADTPELPSVFNTFAAKSKTNLAYMYQLLLAIIRMIELLVMVPFAIIGKIIGLTGMKDPMEGVYYVIHMIFSLGGWLDDSE